jgi:hypothetical protein
MERRNANKKRPKDERKLEDRQKMERPENGGRQAEDSEA